MRRILFFAICALMLMQAPLRASDYRIIKVLPHRLDQKGREALSPSLFERNAYQVFLREHPKQVTALRFNVQWKGKVASTAKLKIEARGAIGNVIHTITLEKPARKTGWFSNWTDLTLAGDDYKKFGSLIAWRATLYDGDLKLGEQQSFLW